MQVCRLRRVANAKQGKYQNHSAQSLRKAFGTIRRRLNEILRFGAKLRIRNNDTIECFASGSNQVRYCNMRCWPMPTSLGQKAAEYISSASPQTTDMRRPHRNDRFVPTTDMARDFNFGS